MVSKNRASKRAQQRAARVRLGVIGAGVVTVAIIVLCLGWTKTESQPSAVSVVIQADQGSQFDEAAFVQAVSKVALEHARAGGGTMKVRTVAGDQAVLAAEVDLAVRRENEPEQDPQLIRTTIDERVAGAIAAALAVDAGMAEGRGLPGWARAVAEDRPVAGGRWDVLVSSFGLPTLDPADTRILMATEPTAAVASVPDSSIAELTQAQVHWFFPRAAGSQEPLNLRTATWREGFLRSYLERSGAALVATTEPNTMGTVYPGSPSVPSVPNLPDPTTRPAAQIEPPVAGKTLVTTLDAGALFVPDTADLLDEGQASSQLDALVSAWATGLYASVECVGRTALFTEPHPGYDLDLSHRRAEKIAGLLAAANVPATPVGRGHDDPLPGAGVRSPSQRSVICTASPS